MNYYNLEKTAEVLGLNTGDVNRLREQNKLRAFRDGSNWKFRQEDVENYLTEMIKQRSHSQPLDSDLLNNSDEELPTQLADSSSFDTLINTTADTFAIHLQPESDHSFNFDDSSNLSGTSSSDSSIQLDETNPDALNTGSDSGIALLDDDDLFDLNSSSNIELGESDPNDIVLGGSSGSGSNLNLGSDSSIALLSDENDSGFSLDSLAMDDEKSDVIFSLKDDSVTASSIITLDDSADSDTATTLGTDDKFQLLQKETKKAQTAPKVEEPKEEDDDDIFSLIEENKSDLNSSSTKEADQKSLSLSSVIAIDEGVGSETATVMGLEEDFQLTPDSDTQTDDSSSESSSQVIELDEDTSHLFMSEDEASKEAPPVSPAKADDPFASFDSAPSSDNVPTFDSVPDFSSDPFSSQGLSPEPLPSGFGGPSPAGFSSPQPSTMGEELPMTAGCSYAMGKGCRQEPQFSGMAIGLGLVPCLILLILAGIGTYELVRTIWSWDQPFGLTGMLLETIGNLFKII